MSDLVKKLDELWDLTKTLKELSKKLSKQAKSIPSPLITPEMAQVLSTAERENQQTVADVQQLEQKIMLKRKESFDAKREGREEQVKLPAAAYTSKIVIEAAQEMNRLGKEMERIIAFLYEEGIVL